MVARVLSEITLPPNLTKIGASAFNGCTSVSEIILPPNRTKIGAYAFSDCTLAPKKEEEKGCRRCCVCPGLKHSLNIHASVSEAHLLASSGMPTYIPASAARLDAK